MDADRKKCIWYEQCGGNCPEDCSDYTPSDDSDDVEFYNRVLRENAEEYENIVADFDDGRCPE